MIRTIIWDWNGTLVNDAPHSWGIFNHLAERKGIPPLSFERYQSIYGHPVQAMWERGGFDFSHEPFENLSREWHDLYVDSLKQIELHDDSREVLEKFKKNGTSQFVLSALPHSILTDSIQRYQLTPLFLEISGLGDLLGASKIDNGTVLIKKHAIAPKSTVIIGDSSHDAEVARALGTHCILVNRGYEDHARLIQNEFPVVDSLIKAHKLIESEMLRTEDFLYDT